MAPAPALLPPPPFFPDPDWAVKISIARAARAAAQKRRQGKSPVFTSPRPLFHSS